MGPFGVLHEMSNLIPLEDAAKMLGLSVDKLGEMRSNSEIFGYKDGASWKFKMQELERVADEFGFTLNTGGISEAVGDAAMLAGAIGATKEVTLAQENIDYVVRLVRATRETPALETGASPRARRASPPLLALVSLLWRRMRRRSQTPTRRRPSTALQTITRFGPAKPENHPCPRKSAAARPARSGNAN